MHRCNRALSSICACLVSALLLTGLLCGVSPVRGDDPPLPRKDESDPPLPKTKKMLVVVVAETAEVRAGDDLIATVRKGSKLEFVKQKDEFYLVVVDGKKGWIKASEVKPTEVPPPTKEGPPPPKEGPIPPKEGTTGAKTLKSPDGTVVVTIRDGRVLRFKDSKEVWRFPGGEGPAVQAAAVCFAGKSSAANKSSGPVLYAVSGNTLYALETNQGKLLWSNRFSATTPKDNPALSFDDANDQVILSTGGKKLSYDAPTGKAIR